MSKTLKITLWIVVVLFVVLVVLPPVINKFILTEADQVEIAAQEQKEADLNDAYTMARQLTKPLFKVPSSVEFQPASEVVVTPKDGSIYKMRFWTEAKNSFGVPLRTTYDCTVQKIGDKWSILLFNEVE